MGHRDLRRIPLDFSWPLNKVWKGYINPYKGCFPCHPCQRSGLNPATKQLDDDWYDLNEDGIETGRYEPVKDELYQKACQVLKDSGRDMNWDFLRRGWQHNLTQEEVNILAKKDCLFDFTHTHDKENGWVRREDNYIPTADEVNFQSFFSLGGQSGRGHLLKFRARKLGIYGLCQLCCGKGDIDNTDKAEIERHNNWEDYEPPEGPGYQLWETTSEGSPITPVFDTAEKLARHCEEYVTICGQEHLSYDEWLQMFTENTTDIGSLIVMDEKGLRPVIKAMNEQKNKQS